MPDGYTIWTMTIRSAGATSLNFVFRNTTLPPNSEMYLYAASEFMVMGPITASHVHEGIYATDVIYGEEVVLAVRMPSSQLRAFVLEVDEAVHGYDGRGSRDYNDAGECQVNVDCTPFGNNWQVEKRSVAMIINGPTRLCSGALINTACPSLRPLFLTAFHCIDGPEGSNGYGELSNSEIAELSNWIFRFNYDGIDPFPGDFDPNTNPNGNNCRGLEPTSWLSYSGAVLRSSWFDSDFALLELTGSLLNQNLALAGWTTDFGFQSPTQTEFINAPITTIHHPRGDVKMISIDSDNALGVINSGQTLWFVDDWDTGNTERASSGAPMFNSQRRIVGQLLGGEIFQDDCDPDKGSFFGRFDQSWTGGGTSDSRLSDILGSGVTSTNSISIPRITFTGNNVVCTDGKLFSLSNPIGGAAVTWSTTPSEFFQNPTGTGSSAVLLPVSSNTTGHATLSFTMSFNNGCPPIQMSHSVWVGVPMAPDLVTTPPRNPNTNTVEINVNDLMTAQVTDFSGASPSSIVWQVSGDIDFKNPPSGLQSTVRGKSVGFGDLRVESSNQCGTSPSSLVVVEVLQPLWDPSEEELFSITPNPANEYLIVNATWNNPSQIPGNIELRDLRGKVLLSQSTQGEHTRISLDQVSKGILFLQVTVGNHSEMKKVIIIH